mmetsp:Transcript_6929/g.16994  ORF Transcript_6929/g.16994 Transcript_6929/m.16994 type:complete len:302 (+) Transcript_6929:588-1493(+)
MICTPCPILAAPRDSMAVTALAGTPVVLSSEAWHVTGTPASRTRRNSPSHCLSSVSAPARSNPTNASRFARRKSTVLANSSGPIIPTAMQMSPTSMSRPALARAMPLWTASRTISKLCSCPMEQKEGAYLSSRSLIPSLCASSTASYAIRSKVSASLNTDCVRSKRSRRDLRSGKGSLVRTYGLSSFSMSSSRRCSKSPKVSPSPASGAACGPRCPCWCIRKSAFASVSVAIPISLAALTKSLGVMKPEPRTSKYSKTCLVSCSETPGKWSRWCLLASSRIVLTLTAPSRWRCSSTLGRRA